MIGNVLWEICRLLVGRWPLRCEKLEKEVVAGMTTLDVVHCNRDMVGNVLLESFMLLVGR